MCSAGLSQEAKDSIYEFGIENSVPSPCKSDSIRRRDEYGNLVLVEDINSDEKYEELTKRFHTAHKSDLCKQWQYQTADLQMRERLSKHKPVISRKTFSKYFPNHVQKKPYISQFGCEKGIQFRWIHKSMMKTLQDNHHCGETR